MERLWLRNGHVEDIFKMEKEKKTTAHSQPYESVVRKQKSTNQEAVLHHTLGLLEPWPWIC